MKVRIKFTKTGSTRFLSHLDMMRYFQKALRRAGADVSLSEGYSPHMLMSFALPLSLGMTSLGEYFDLDLRSLDSIEKLKEDLNKQMSSEIEVVSIIQIPEDKANKCMSLINAADYSAQLYYTNETPCFVEPEVLEKGIRGFLAQDKIIEVRKTKRSEEETDIKPFIHKIELKEDGRSIFLKLGAGGNNHLKCELVLNALCRFMGMDTDVITYRMCREELYSEKNGALVPLCELGI